MVVGNGFEFHYSLKNEWVMDQNSALLIKKVVGNGFDFHYSLQK